MGRPRSEQAHKAALETTLDILSDAGVEGVTFDEVSARSGVAKSTLYRHFGSRNALILKSVKRCIVEQSTPDTGSLADDLRILFARFSHTEEDSRINELMPLIMDAAKRDPEMDETLTTLLAERRRPIRTVLQLAQLRGEIGAELDLDDALTMVIGPFTHRKMVERKPVTPQFAENVLVGVIAGLRATAGEPATA